MASGARLPLDCLPSPHASESSESMLMIKNHVAFEYENFEIGTGEIFTDSNTEFIDGLEQGGTGI